MIDVGSSAPAFELQNHEGQTVSLTQFEGQKVFLYFYPKDDTPGCTTEACGLRDVYDDILDLGCVVLGISPDGIKSHGRFREKYDLPFYLLADEDHQTCERYDAWGEKKMYGRTYMGVKRISYLIDEYGNVLHAWPKVSPAKHAAEVLEVLRA